MRKHEIFINNFDICSFLFEQFIYSHDDEVSAIQDVGCHYYDDYHYMIKLSFFMQNIYFCNFQTHMCQFFPIDFYIMPTEIIITFMYLSEVCLASLPVRSRIWGTYDFT